MLQAKQKADKTKMKNLGFCLLFYFYLVLVLVLASYFEDEGEDAPWSSVRMQ